MSNNEDFSLDFESFEDDNEDFSLDFDYESEEEEENDVFLGFDKKVYIHDLPNESNDENVSINNSDKDENVQAIEDDEKYSLEFDDEDEEYLENEDGEDQDSFYLDDLELSFEQEKDDNTEEDSEESHENRSDEEKNNDYHSVVNAKPEDRINEDNVIDKNKNDKNDFSKISIMDTVYGVDMTNPFDESGTWLKDSELNIATDRKGYKRNENGVLSREQQNYFIKLSRNNLSNSRYPDEYVSLARSNEELLDISQKAHKKIIKDLIANGATYQESQKINKNIKNTVTLLDLEVIDLIARMKYASTTQIQRALSKSYAAVSKILWNLKQMNLVKTPDSPYYSQKLWCLSELGMSISNYNLRAPSVTGVSIAQLQHSTVVNNIAAYIYSGTVNVLRLDEFPAKNRITSRGEIEFGDDFISETQLRSSLGKISSSYMGMKADSFIPEIVDNIEEQFSSWKSKFSHDKYLTSPEREIGNEYMWILYPPVRIPINFHIPDLVIPRERDEDGSPNSIAVEVELKAKTLEDYKNTLRSYEEDSRLYKKVVWVCSKTQTANMLIKAADEYTNLLDTDKLDIVPIETEKGTFKGSNVLALG